MEKYNYHQVQTVSLEQEKSSPTKVTIINKENNFGFRKWKDWLLQEAVLALAMLSHLHKLGSYTVLLLLRHTLAILVLHNQCCLYFSTGTTYQKIKTADNDSQPLCWSDPYCQCIIYTSSSLTPLSLLSPKLPHYLAFLIS